MKAPLVMICAALSAATAGANPFFDLSESEQMTSVASKAYNGYVRTRNADGTYKAETFAFGNGGDLGDYLGRFAMADPTFDTVGFSSIAHILAAPLAKQNYVPGFDPKTTNLFIMVYWGLTSGAVNTKDGYTQDVLNFANARLLGFDTEPPFDGMSNPMEDAGEFFWGPSYRDNFMRKIHASTMSEIEVNRYYVILRAFDFQTAWKQKTLKLLWETRFSLTQRLHDFGRDLPVMAQSASAYFGHDSYGLVRRPVPEGRVEVGEATVVEDSVSSGDISGIAGDWRGKSTAFSLIRVHFDRSGASTVEYPREGWTAPATVTVAGRDVAIWVPGWGVSFHGRIGAKKISGTLAQYGHGSPISLYREGAAAGPGLPNGP
jgi:hypothetical protein